MKHLLQNHAPVARKSWQFSEAIWKGEEGTPGANCPKFSILHTWSQNIHFLDNYHSIKLMFFLRLFISFSYVKLIKLNGLSHFISVTKKKNDDEPLYMSFTRKLIKLCNGLIICLYKERICLWCISAPIICSRNGTNVIEFLISL